MTGFSNEIFLDAALPLSAIHRGGIVNSTGQRIDDIAEWMT